MIEAVHDELLLNKEYFSMRKCATFPSDFSAKTTGIFLFL